MPSAVHIVVSDRGWILERLAKEISTRLPYVSYDTAPDPDAIIQYYMTYGTFRGGISAHEIGLFTHLEDQPDAARKFFSTAAAMDVCVAMSPATAGLLVGNGARIETISPGVDLGRFHRGSASELLGAPTILAARARTSSPRYRIFPILIGSLPARVGRDHRNLCPRRSYRNSTAPLITSSSRPGSRAGRCVCWKRSHPVWR